MGYKLPTPKLTTSSMVLTEVLQTQQICAAFLSFDCQTIRMDEMGCDLQGYSIMLVKVVWSSTDNMPKFSNVLILPFLHAYSFPILLQGHKKQQQQPVLRRMDIPSRVGTFL